MEIVSKFRTGYWIRQFILFAGTLLLMVVCIRFSLDQGKVDYLSMPFWIACLIGIDFLENLLRFLFADLKQLIISEEGIEIKYLLTKKKEFIYYPEILNFQINRIKA